MARPARWPVLCAAALFAVSMCGCGYQYPASCYDLCVRFEADAGCVAGPPLCTQHCGGPTCPDGYALYKYVGLTCAPMPAADRILCL